MDSQGQDLDENVDPDAENVADVSMATTDSSESSSSSSEDDESDHGSVHNVESDHGSVDLGDGSAKPLEASPMAEEEAQNITTISDLSSVTTNVTSSSDSTITGPVYDSSIYDKSATKIVRRPETLSQKFSYRNFLQLKKFKLLVMSFAHIKNYDYGRFIYSGSITNKTCKNPKNLFYDIQRGWLCHACESLVLPPPVSLSTKSQPTATQINDVDKALSIRFQNVAEWKKFPTGIKNLLTTGDTNGNLIDFTIITLV